MRMRPWAWFPATSEGITQRELNQARVTDGGYDLAEGSRTLGQPSVRPAVADAGCATEGGFHVGAGRVGKVGVIPDIEEVHAKTQLLTFGDRKVLDQRKIPVLLERTPVEVPSHISKSSRTCDRIGNRRRREVVDIQVTVEAVVNVAGGGSSTDRSAWSNAATQGWECKPISDEGCSCPRIEYGERVTRLRGGDPANCPVAQGLVGEAGSLGEEWQIVAIADGQAMRPIKVRQAIRIPDVALIIPRC